MIIPRKSPQGFRSPDPQQALTQPRQAKGLDLSFPLLCDYNGATAKAFGAYLELEEQGEGSPCRLALDPGLARREEPKKSLELPTARTISGLCFRAMSGMFYPPNMATKYGTMPL